MTLLMSSLEIHAQVTVRHYTYRVNEIIMTLSYWLNLTQTVSFSMFNELKYLSQAWYFT